MNAFIFCLLLALPVRNDIVQVKQGSDIHGKVIKIKDGNTIEILFGGKPLTIRLAHIVRKC